MSSWTPKAKQYLKSHPQVEKVTEKTVVYKASFKRTAIKEYNDGVSAKEVFERAGFDVSIFPYDYCRYTIRRWILASRKHGIGVFDEELRGSAGNSRGPRKKTSSKMTEAQLKARVAYLEAEVDFLKKLRALAKRGK